MCWKGQEECQVWHPNSFKSTWQNVEKDFNCVEKEECKDKKRNY